MKKNVLMMAGAMLALTTQVDAQMTLQHTFANGNCNNWVIENNPNNEPLQVVNLLLDGKKFVLQDMVDNQVRIYNLDYTLWKTINLPTISGATAGTAYYISENLFKMDNKVDMAVLYTGSGPVTNLIIDETGAIINTIDSSVEIVVYNVGVDSFIAIAGSYPTNDIQGLGNAMKVYSLPGTIPCNECSSSSLGVVAPVYNGASVSMSDANPNPTNGDTKVYYTIPNNIQSATINLIDQAGRVLNTYKLYPTSSFIVIDAANLAPGIYYYSLQASGITSITKKLVVAK